MSCTFLATIGRKFAPLIGLKDEDMNIDAMITLCTTAVTNITSKILGGGGNFAGTRLGPPEMFLASVVRRGI